MAQEKHASLQQLFERARSGDSGATGALQHELEIQLARMTRYVLRTRKASSAIDQRILAEVEALSQTADVPADDEERLVHQVASRVCAAVMSQVHSRSPAGLRDTVCT